MADGTGPTVKGLSKYALLVFILPIRGKGCAAFHHACWFVKGSLKTGATPKNWLTSRPSAHMATPVCMVAKVLGNPTDSELNWLPKDTDAYKFLRKVCPQGSGVNLSSTYPRASSACLDLLKALLCWDPQERLTASDAQKHEYVKHYYPREPPPPPEPFDWTFDGFKPTTKTVQAKLYEECARYHPEIRARDGLSPSGAPAGGYPMKSEARPDRSPRHSQRDATPTKSKSERSITPVPGALNGLARAAMRFRSTTPPPNTGTPRSERRTSQPGVPDVRSR
ncbi:unnamed protein product [Durusdinium trenchii]|uniref:Uncharacterized protein n=1 Tax=Durusdinium trenchii TaxID=1381693 RepID=A0ABP0MXC9_9DINO